MIYVTRLTETGQLELKSKVRCHLENDPFLMVRRNGTFSMLKPELKNMVLHQKDFSMLHK